MDRRAEASLLARRRKPKPKPEAGKRRDLREVGVLWARFWGRVLLPKSTTGGRVNPLLPFKCLGREGKAPTKTDYGKQKRYPYSNLPSKTHPRRVDSTRNLRRDTPPDQVRPVFFLNAGQRLPGDPELQATPCALAIFQVPTANKYVNMVPCQSVGDG